MEVMGIIHAYIITPPLITKFTVIRSKIKVKEELDSCSSIIFRHELELMIIPNSKVRVDSNIKLKNKNTRHRGWLGERVLY